MTATMLKKTTSSAVNGSQREERDIADKDSDYGDAHLHNPASKLKITLAHFKWGDLRYFAFFITRSGQFSAAFAMFPSISF